MTDRKLLKIIRRLWSAVYDLLFIVEGRSRKTLAEVHRDLDAIEMLCRPYAGIDEDENLDAEGKEGEGDGE